MRSGDVLELLREHYLPASRAPGFLFMPEIGAPGGKRRADLLVAPVSIAGSAAARLIGHEIKVSRADVVNELKDPTKADPWLRHCSYWWLVVSDPKLIEGLEIPELWGVMSPPSGRSTRSMTVLVPAPKLQPEELSGDVLTRVASYVVARMDQKISRAEGEAASYKAIASRLERDLSEARATSGPRESPHVKRIARIVHRIEEQRWKGSAWFEGGEAADDLVVEAVLDAARTRAQAEDLRRTLSRLIEVTDDPLKYVRERLSKISEGISA